MESENIKAITKFLFIENNIEDLNPSDLVIILCNNNIKGIGDKFEELYKNGVINTNSRVIISGNHGALDDFEEKECDLVAQEIISRFNKQPCKIILEDKATNIYENLLFSKGLVGRLESYQNILIIGASFALRRVKMCASRLGYPLDKMGYVGTVDKNGRNIAKDTWWKNEEAKIRVYEELERIGKYLAKGDLDIK